LCVLLVSVQYKKKSCLPEVAEMSRRGYGLMEVAAFFFFYFPFSNLQMKVLIVFLFLVLSIISFTFGRIWYEVFGISIRPMQNRQCGVYQGLRCLDSHSMIRKCCDSVAMLEALQDCVKIAAHMSYFFKMINNVI
jgi:hypothetical protein